MSQICGQHFNDFSDADDSSDDESSSKRRRLLVQGICLIACLDTVLNVKRVVGRNCNERRDRKLVLLSLESMSDADWKRHYRLKRPEFNELLKLIREDIEPNELGIAMAERSSGGYIHPILKLAITLRMLAGGSYLDISFGYKVAYSSVYKILEEVLKAIDTKLHNIVFPFDDEGALARLAESFLRYGGNVLNGTVAAGDGVVFKMQKPSPNEVGENCTSFMTRKGYYAVGMQGFVDGNCKFLSIASKTCASAHDSTSYMHTTLSDRIKNGDLPPQYHIVLDAAYPCTLQELSPWRNVKDDEAKMAFNYYLSCQRQCIERAFGMLVQRWGILWRALRGSMDTIQRIVRVCCKLHNICIDSFTRGEEIECHEHDIFWQRERYTGPLQRTPMYDRPEPGMGGRQGARNDLGGDKRLHFTKICRDENIRRPRININKIIKNRIRNKKN